MWSEEKPEYYVINILNRTGVAKEFDWYRMFSLPFWLLWGSLTWDIIYSEGLYILILCAHFKRFYLYFSSADLVTRSQFSFFQVPHYPVKSLASIHWITWFIAWPFLLLGNFKYTAWHIATGKISFHYCSSESLLSGALTLKLYFE